MIDPYFLWGICEFVLSIVFGVYREREKKRSGFRL